MVISSLPYLSSISTNKTYQLLFEGSFIGSDSTSDFTITPFEPDQIDWDLFNEGALGAHLAPLLHRSLSKLSIQDKIPEKTRTHLNNSYNQVLAQNIVLQQVFIDFASLLDTEQIPVVPLKGIYLSEAVYKDIGVRHLSDIDVLIQEEDLETICKLMEKCGWSVRSATMHSKIAEEQFTPAHPVTLVKNQVQIELHTHLYNSNEGADISKDELWNDTHTEQFLGIGIRQLSAEMFLQHLCLHLHKHLMGHELKILSFCDIREFLIAKRGLFSWQRFRQLTEQYNCKEEIDQVLYLCTQYWNVDVPDDFFSSEIMDEELKERFWSFLEGASKEEEQVLKNKLNSRTRKVGQLKSNRDKLLFIWGSVFPTAAFMRKRYNLDERSWLILWYLYRPLDLSIKTMKALLGKR